MSRNAEMDLEQRLFLLIDAYREHRSARALLEVENQKQAQAIAHLENQCVLLKSRLDELGQDRFTLKRLKDERKQLRRKLQSLLNRVATLEEELMS